MKKNLIVCLIGLAVIILSAFSACQVESTPQATSTSQRIEQTPTQSKAPLITPSVTPVSELPPITQTNLIDESAGLLLPDLWTNIDKSKIDIFPLAFFRDYAYAKDGSMWMAGSFGVIHQTKDGHQDWYSIKNGLGITGVMSMGISPSDEVWVGGYEGELYRFDGKEWIDEGKNLPIPIDTRTHFSCYSHKITGIDFDKNGNVWIMTGGIELYTKVMSLWVNFPFPKEILPMGGGGGCPAGIRVVSNKDITIKRYGCCMMDPIAYHFDGNKWIINDDYSIVDNARKKRHMPYKKALESSDFNRSGDVKWPFPIKSVSNYGWSDRLSLSIDKIGYVGVTDNETSFKIVNGEFVENPPIAYLATPPKQINPRFQFEYGKKVWLDDFLRFLKNKNPDSYEDDFNSVASISDDTSLVSYKGSIWVVEKNNWQELKPNKTDQAFKYLIEDQEGVIYAATDTGVFEIDGESLNKNEFERQDETPIVSSSEKSESCSFSRSYISVECFPLYKTQPGVHFSVLALSAQDDGSIIYVNNRIIAKRIDGNWKSFYFDTLEFNSAVVDPQGNIWVIAKANGFIKFSPDIFDDYGKNKISQ